MSQIIDSTTTDPDLIQACLNGDEPAWKELVARYGRLVYSIPFRYGLGAADADDIFQNVFIIVHRRLETLKDQTLLAPWLITVTARETQRWCKRTRDHSPLDDTAADSAEPPLERVQQWELQYAVHQALAQLEPRCRELLTALFLDGHPASYQEISARLGLTNGSIGPTRARCFKKLEAILMKMGVDVN